MTLASGTRLGPYEILGPLGAGGMGEVFRARDTRLGREVALKVLPSHLTSNPDARARFEREARSISALNHPHICTLHDVGRDGDSDYLVMELVEGETLEQRLQRGPLPPAQVLKLGAQIAEALDRAHRAGIVHRDLKPGNVMLIRSGVKVMDFGLARATGLTSSASGLTNTPTVTRPLTAEGTIVGTFQYMAPEQLEGREADARTDLWALGCVLYEMATGRRAFDGASQASLISAIMKDEPRSIASLAPLAPAALERIVQRCLAKDPDERWQNARDVAHELEWIGRDASSSSAAAPTARKRTPALGYAAALAVTAALAAGLTWLATRPQKNETPLSLTVQVPRGLEWEWRRANLALSPDGRRLAFSATDSAGDVRLYVREMSGMTAQPLPGTIDGQLPFWSPDGRHVAFFAGGRLRRVALAGGLPEVIADAAGRGGSWGRGDRILFAAGAEGPIFQVPARGGKPEAVTALDTANGENGHRFPSFLPDGRHFLYISTPSDESGLHDVWMGAIGSRERKRVVRADGTPAYADGWLLYRKTGLLVAQRFDPGNGSLHGSPVEIGEVGMGDGYLGAPHAWVASNGILLHLQPGGAASHMVWIDRQGRQERFDVLEGSLYEPDISPDGSRIVVARSSSGGATQSGADIWMVDVARRAATRFTFDKAFNHGGRWSADGRWIYYASNQSGSYGLYRKATTGGGEPQLVARGPGFTMECCDVSPDGRWAVVAIESPRTGEDLWLVNVASGTLQPLFASRFDENFARISPDGTRIAYASTETGRPEVYVESFPEPGEKTQISATGGYVPKWRRDGRELFFEGTDRAAWSVPVSGGSSPRFGTPSRLLPPRDSRGWCPSPDASRFLDVVGEKNLDPVAVIHWMKLVEK